MMNFMQIQKNPSCDLLTLVSFRLQLLIWMREQKWTADGANHICKKTENKVWNILTQKEKLYLPIS